MVFTLGWIYCNTWIIMILIDISKIFTQIQILIESKYILIIGSK